MSPYCLDANTHDKVNDCINLKLRAVKFYFAMRTTSHTLYILVVIVTEHTSREIALRKVLIFDQFHRSQVAQHLLSTSLTSVIQLV